MFLFCLVFAMSLCASVYMCFVVTCWDRADLLALVCGVCCKFVTFPLVSWVVWYLIVSIPDLCTLTYFEFLMLLRLFIAALLSPAGKGLTSWLLLVMFIVFLLLSHVISWVRCGT